MLDNIIRNLNNPNNLLDTELFYALYYSRNCERLEITLQGQYKDTTKKLIEFIKCVDHENKSYKNPTSEHFVHDFYIFYSNIRINFVIFEVLK
jgi:hypothetical protein